MLSRISNFIIKIFTFSLFYSRILAVINIFINYVQLNINLNSRIIFPYIKKRTTKNFQILTYHRVNDDNDQFFHRNEDRYI